MSKNKKQQNSLIFILDRSGSMHSIKEDAIGGFNEFVDQQLQAPGITKMTLVQFNHHYERLYYGKKLSEVEPLTAETYRPSGQTALLDAVGKAITDRLEDENDKADRTVCVILTDGHENSSREYKLADVRALIEDCQQRLNWTFLYLGVDMEAFDEAMSMGIKRDFIGRYEKTGAGTRNANLAASKMALRSYSKDEDEDWDTTLEDEIKKA